MTTIKIVLSAMPGLSGARKEAPRLTGGFGIEVEKEFTEEMVKELYEE